jgi:hypothetical protein
MTGFHTQSAGMLPRSNSLGASLNASGPDTQQNHHNQQQQRFGTANVIPNHTTFQQIRLKTAVSASSLPPVNTPPASSNQSFRNIPYSGSSIAPPPTADVTAAIDPRNSNEVRFSLPNKALPPSPQTASFQSESQSQLQSNIQLQRLQTAAVGVNLRTQHQFIQQQQILQKQQQQQRYIMSVIQQEQHRQNVLRQDFKTHTFHHNSRIRPSNSASMLSFAPIYST